MIPEQEIMPNPTQPRRHFDRQELANLAQSIRANGILQPITVRAVPGGYELIAGERRLRAARLAGLTQIPSILINADDRKTAIFSLLENLQRQDLSFFEEADAIQKLMNVYGLSRRKPRESSVWRNPRSPISFAPTAAGRNPTHLGAGTAHRAPCACSAPAGDH